MTKKDPFSNFILLMRGEGAHSNPPSIRLGQVVSLNPLLVKVDDLQLTKDNILINDTLADHEIDTNVGVLKVKNRLKKDDIVLIIPTIDKQTWIILCKVVNP